jgi:hypothetical protein
LASSPVALSKLLSPNHLNHNFAVSDACTAKIYI